MLTTPARSALLAFGAILCGLVGRAALDKVLALRGGGELVAQWAQLASVTELVSGPAISGVGVGIAVVVAQARDATAQRAALRRALALGLGVSACVAILAVPLAWLAPGQGGWLALGSGWVALGAAIGWLSVVAGCFNGYWLGLRQRGRMFLLALAVAAVPLLAAFAIPSQHTLVAVAIAHAVPALALLAFLPRGPLPASPALRAYVLPGLVIGILSPLSTLAARAIVADAMSWHDAGVLQALWRVTDWVGAIAGGVLSIVFLPRLAAAAGTPRLRTELARATLLTTLPSAAVLAAMLVVHEPLFVLLYDERFVVPTAAAALFFAGVAVRVASWAALFALYATRRTRAIAIGEVLSVPLFAAILALWPRPLGLEAVGFAWLAAFAAYAVFNFAAALRR